MSQKLFKLGLLAVLGLFVVACGGGYAESEAVQVMREADFEASEDVATSLQLTGYSADSASSTVEQLGVEGTNTQRLIIKSAEMSITVEDAALAVQAATNIATGIDGYIVSQSVYGNTTAARRANLQMAVPVAKFEMVLSALRDLGDVYNESASGQDVTEEFFDLNARLENLQATQERLRTFLSETTDVKDTLEVDRELRQVEGEINVLQGRVKYLADRAAFSTINIEFSPVPPAPVASVWQPGSTAQTAFVDLIEGVQSFTDAVIYMAIAWGPWVALFAGIVYIARRLGWGLPRWSKFGRPLATSSPDATE